MAKKAKAALLVALAAAIVLAAWRLHAPALLRAALLRIDRLGPAAPLAFIGLYVAASVCLVPASILTLGAGAVFGVARGCVYVSAASLAGATAAFLVGRYLARGWVARKFGGNPAFRAIDEAMASEGWKIVGLTRLSPVFPFILLNYALSLTKVSLRDFVLASWVGMIPGTVLFVYIGSLAGDLASLGARHRRTPAEWALYGVGLAATAAVTVHISRIARRALEKRISV